MNNTTFVYDRHVGEFFKDKVIPDNRLVYASRSAVSYRKKSDFAFLFIFYFIASCSNYSTNFTIIFSDA